MDLYFLDHLCFFWTLGNINYHITKKSVYFEKRPAIILKRRICLTKFRLSNHSLPVELLQYTGINKELRICTKCNNNDDEIHYLN